MKSFRENPDSPESAAMTRDNERAVFAAQQQAKLPVSFCPVCFCNLDAAMCLNDKAAQPSAGDLSICLNCGEMLWFNHELVLHSLPKESFDALPEREQLLMERSYSLIKQRGRFR